jgi:uncharacterized protein YkwD
LALAAPSRFAGCGGAVPAAINPAYEQKVIELVNIERDKNGLPPLKFEKRLQDSARYHAVDMDQDDYFNHDSYDLVNGKLVQVCDTWQRLDSFYDGWDRAAENIAAGYGSPEEVVKGWMDSSGHRENILNEHVSELGVGYSTGSASSGGYWVQDFGHRPGVYPLIINSEAASTDQQTVSLYIYGDWEEVRLRNDDQAWGPWLPFQDELDWELATGVGTHTVWAEMRSGENTATSSDEIYLTSSALPVLGGLPVKLQFAYSKASRVMLPLSQTLTPNNEGNNENFTWSLLTEGGWFEVTPSSGTTPQSFSIQINDVQGLPDGVYTGKVTVTASNGVVDSPQTIQVELVVISDSMNEVFLPHVHK